MKDETIANWNSFKSEIANEDVSTHEIKEDLAEAGINIDEFLIDIKTTVQKCYRSTSKKAAEQGIKKKSALIDKIYKSLLGLSRDEMIQRILDLAQRGNSKALVFSREESGKRISDTDLKSLLVDFIISEGEKDANK
jgi:hypothetical protein